MKKYSVLKNFHETPPVGVLAGNRVKELKS